MSFCTIEESIQSETPHTFSEGIFTPEGTQKGLTSSILMIQKITLLPPCWHCSLAGTSGPSTKLILLHLSWPSRVSRESYSSSASLPAMGTKGENTHGVAPILPQAMAKPIFCNGPEQLTTSRTQKKPVTTGHNSSPYSRGTPQCPIRYVRELQVEGRKDQGSGKFVLKHGNYSLTVDDFKIRLNAISMHYFLIIHRKM